MKNILKEFRDFINKGNVFDLAVGVIIGNAFSKIVSSLVNDIFTPILGIIIGGHDFGNLSIRFKDATINYGSFIQNTIDFILMAFCIFMMVKLINVIKHNFDNEKAKEKKIENKTQIKSNEEILLEEIRDLLKDKKVKNKKNEK